MKKKGECKYCGEEISYDSIRCYQCDSAWQDGFKDGQQSIKDKLGEIFQTIKNLINNQP